MANHLSKKRKQAALQFPHVVLRLITEVTEVTEADISSRAVSGDFVCMKQFYVMHEGTIMAAHQPIRAERSGFRSPF